ALSVVEAGARAVNEHSLPKAFYGLTYLPFLAALTLVGAQERRIGRLFAAPAPALAVAMPAVFLPASLGHAKATFPLPAALAALFAIEAVLFRDRRHAVLAVAAALVAAWGIEPFAATVLEVRGMAGSRLECLTVSAAVLLAAGLRLDRAIARLPLA